MGPPTPLPPFPPFPQGFGLPPGARGLHGSELPALLLDFFLASSPASRGPEARGPGFRSASRRSGPGFQASMLPSVRGWCPGIRSTSRPAFRGPGTGVRSPGSGGFQTFRRPCFQGPGLPALLSGGQTSSCQGTILSGFFLTSLPAFRLSGFQKAMLPQGFPGSMLSGDRGPGLQAFRRQGPDFPQGPGDRGFQDAFRRFSGAFRGFQEALLPGGQG